MSKTDMDTLNTDILAIIRASGGSNGTRNVIITGGTETSHQAPLQIDPSIISSDSYLIATFHYYQPFNFTSSSADSRDNESWGTVQDKELLTTRFNEVYQWALTNQIPVFLGEFGADNTGGYNYSTGDLNTISGNTTGFADGGPDNASRVEYHRFVVEQAINKGFSFAAWDSGPKSNKTIHKRTDSPTTLNYNINDFSVTSYNPKVTTISTVVDNTTWVEDVKNALLDTSANSCSSMTIWDGVAWSNEAPDTNSYAVINGTYSTITNGDITACLMKVDADITIDGATDAIIGEVLVMAGNTLTIDETSSLTVSGNFTNSGGTVTLNSTEDDFSSLIVEGTATGDITYNRYVNAYDTNPDGGGWDLVGSPTVMTITDFTIANGATLQVLGDDYAFSQYDNALGQWVRYPTASPLGSFTTGQGYSMATNAGDGATVAFTGAMQTTTQNINIIDNNDANAGAGRRWNLVSNPFPSYINGNTAAGTTNFLGVNTSVINDQYWAVYGWDGTQYVAKNLTDAQGFWVAPGQGFWVAAASTLAAPLSFTPDMRTTTGTGDFVTGPVLLDYHVALKLYNGETQKAATKFYFRDGLSLDLDPGYDAGAFNQSMALSTKLSVGSNQTAFSINAMGMDAMQNTRVPLEIRQNAGQAFTISIADMELPQDIYVYLEDTLNGTLTSLKEQDFELVAQSNLSGVDRFFIIFKSNSVLSNGDTLGINALNVYKANTDNFVTIAGITPELGKLNVSLYNILGQTVREKALSSATATQTISTDGLASGLYIIQLKSGNQVFIQKMILC